MSDFYRDLQNVASDVLGQFKQGSIEYIAVTPGNGPRDNPGPSQEAVPRPIDAVARGVSFKYVDGANIVTTDLQITMPGGGVVPAMGGFIRVDGVRHKIISVLAKPAAGVPVAWVVIFRR